MGQLAMSRNGAGRDRLLFPLPADLPAKEPRPVTERVTIAPVRGGYAILDDSRIVLFGGVRFRTADEAGVFLAEANRRARSVRWVLRRPERAGPNREERRKRTQLSLF